MLGHGGEVSSRSRTCWNGRVLDDWCEDIDQVKELIHLQNAEVSILEYGNHHIDIVLNSEDEALTNKHPDAAENLSLNHIIDRHGQRITTSLTNQYEKCLKTEGILDRNAIDQEYRESALGVDRGKMGRLK